MSQASRCSTPPSSNSGRTPLRDSAHPLTTPPDCSGLTLAQKMSRYGWPVFDAPMVKSILQCLSFAGAGLRFMSKTIGLHSSQLLVGQDPPFGAVRVNDKSNLSNC
jgi:hypothetical protein